MDAPEANLLAEEIRALVAERTQTRAEFIAHANHQIVKYIRAGLLRYYRRENDHAYKWCLDVHLGDLFDPEDRVGYDEGVHSLEEYNSLISALRRAFPEPDFAIRPVNKKQDPKSNTYGVYKWNIRVPL